MERKSKSSLLHVAEFVYAALALFSLTQGPVYRVWMPSAAQVELLPNPSVPHVYFATFLMIQLPALVLFFQRCGTSWLRRQGSRALIAFLGWLALTVVWSTFARQSFPEVVALIVTSIFGLYLATSFSVRRFWLVIASAMAVGVAMSWVAIMRLWDGAVNLQESYWIGIYYNRNSLAPVTAIAIVAATALIYLMWSNRRSQRKSRVLLSVTPAMLLAIYALIELWNTKSQTSPFALATAIAVSVAWLIIRTVCARLSLLRRIRRQSAPVTLALASIVMFFTLRLVGGLQSLPSETTTLNLRRSLWSLSWSGFLEKPWQGWGWMAAWRTFDFFKQGDWWAVFDTEWSHNGYHDILLGGGVLAGAIFVAYLWLSSSDISLQPLSAALPRMLLTVFVLAAATQESFFIGSHFLWALLVAALAANHSVESSVDEKNAGQLST